MSIFNPAWRMGRKNELRTCFRETSSKKVYHSHKFLSRKREHLRGRCLLISTKKLANATVLFLKKTV